MSEFVMEDALEKIKNPQIKKYLFEVVSSYNSGNYRSAIVMLYNVVICDLLYKLKTLDEVYNDKASSNILNNIKGLKEPNANNTDIKEKSKGLSEWEFELINSVKQDTQLLNVDDFNKIIYLKNDRNICAHPVLTDSFSLIIPNRDQTRAHIRNMFEIVFLKEPLLFKKITQDFRDDISKYYDQVGIINIDNFEPYLKTKYFSKLNEAVEEKLFKMLWKLVFKLDENEIKIYRKVNYIALVLLVKQNPKRFLEYVKKDVEWYSSIEHSSFKCNWYDKISDIQIISPIAAIISFMSEFCEFYDIIPDYAKTIIKTEADKNINLFARAIFLNKTIEEHLDELVKFKYKPVDEYNDIFILSYFRDTSINKEQVLFLYKTSIEKCCNNTVKDFVINWFGEIGSYDSAEPCFNNLIRPLMEDFNIDDIIKLLEKMNKQNQIWGDKNFSNYRYIIRNRCNQLLGDTYDFSIFSNLNL